MSTDDSILEETSASQPDAEESRAGEAPVGQPVQATKSRRKGRRAPAPKEPSDPAGDGEADATGPGLGESRSEAAVGREGAEWGENGEDPSSVAEAGFAEDEAAAGGDSEEERETGNSPHALHLVVEAILFASQKPMTAKEILSVLKGAAEAAKDLPDAPARAFGKIREPRLREAIEELEKICSAVDRAYEVRESAAGWQLVTKPVYSPWLRQLFPEHRSARLSAPAMETLAIIAYRQPITRADIEAVRGVAVDGVMQTLLDRGLIKIAGRADIPGRPLLYDTTQNFMEHFGLKHLDDLPNAAELRKVSLPTADAPESSDAQPPSETSGSEDSPVAPEGTPDETESASGLGEGPPAEDPVPEGDEPDSVPDDQGGDAPATDEPSGEEESHEAPADN